MIGFFSKIAAEKLGKAAVYLNDTGKEVNVTAVYGTEDTGDKLYKPIYPDAICVGKISSFQRYEEHNEKSNTGKN